jgi:hypothetical protein
MIPHRPAATNQFASLSQARAYIDAVREGIGSLGPQELIDAVQRLRRAYDEFPELELERPRQELSEDLQSAVQKMPDRAAMALLTSIVGFDPSSSLTWLFEQILKSDDYQFRLRDQQDEILQIISEALTRLDFSDAEIATDFGEVLAQLLTDQHPAGIAGGALARAARFARLRLDPPAIGETGQGSRDGLLAMARRLRGPPPRQRANQHLDLVWPSGRMSFDEFLLQWPCEVELPVDLDDQALVEAAYQAILLRQPAAAEANQYLRLLQNGVVSRPWVIEDLLASEEFRSFERRLRVVCGGYVITEPGRPEAENMPAVTWPWRSAT